MEKVYLEVKQLYVVVKCECGGLFRDAASNSILPTYPPQRSYKCSICGKTQLLSEPEWPHLETEII